MFEDLPRTLTILWDAKQVIKGTIVFVVRVAISLGLLVSGNDVMAAAFGFFALMILIGVGASLITILNLRQSPSTNFTSFQTNTKVNYYRVPDYAVESEVPFFAGSPAPAAPSPQPPVTSAAGPAPVPSSSPRRASS